jgi:hypothetical protein
MLDVCLMFKITLLLTGEVPQRSAFVAKKIQQLLVRNEISHLPRYRV